MELSKKGEELINFYTEMANNGFERSDGDSTKDTKFSNFGARPYRAGLKRDFALLGVKSTLGIKR
jgi:hypothetical protein|tara:strand:- start:930 stop:1124 length:195 start_codon:yes stop_codon:yes gene_type:complete